MEQDGVGNYMKLLKYFKTENPLGEITGEQERDLQWIIDCFSMGFW